MTDDLDDRLRDVVSAAGTQGRLPSAAELRRRGDRRRRVQRVTVGALALIVMGGSYALVAGRGELGGNPAPAGQATAPSAPSSTSTSKSDLVRQEKEAAQTSGSAKEQELTSAGRPRPGPIQLSGPTALGERRFVWVAPDGSATVDARGEPKADGTRFTLRSIGADTFMVEWKTSGRCLNARPNAPLALADCDAGAPFQRFVFSYRGSHLYTIGTPSGQLAIDPTSLNITVTNETPTIFAVTAK
ncbi:hypothetical protein E1263_17485 [Kribbella antibiotica]|uniref:Uncharacterized protein n=1 Tax=Kribbella antibiotica TaxID=190195 RepID=A0A4R4ZLA8_9ACTN|nr:hypothetical protein [Kribbella antibiotica]TDD58866.1 hypothetical protein E1263_17485 [Kribbella antibiotica]